MALLAIAAAASAEAQQPGIARVRGYVFDSLLTGATVPGALVTLRGPTTRQVVADGRGRFIVDSLPPGRYAFTFTHESFAEVGYQPPDREVDLPAGVVTPLFLSTTAGHAIFAALCPDVLEDLTGVVLGQLVNVRTREPVADGEVRVEWTEREVSLALGIDTRNRAARSSTDSLGRYRICGVPNDVSVLLKARVLGMDGPPLELNLAERPIAVRMLSVDLGDPAAGIAANPNPDSGTARLRGTIRGNDGRPVAGAQVLVLGNPRAATSGDGGVFDLGGLPAGSHTVEVRAIGFGRGRQLVELRPDEAARIDMTLTRQAMVLPEITVEERATGQSEFDRRRSTMRGFGRFMTESEIVRRAPIRTEDLFRGIPGFNVVPSGGFDDRIVSTRSLGSTGQCSPTFYLDGARVTVDPLIGGGLPVNPQEIYGIEAYPSSAGTPVEYQSQSQCGVVLIWTHRGGNRRR